jgi:DNA-binding transcriptional regulator YdaS (Cro superfamily)
MKLKFSTYWKLQPVGGKGDFVHKIGMMPTTLRELANGKRQPHRNTMLRIEEATNGLVPVASWFPGFEEEGIEVYPFGRGDGDEQE